ncbi:MAG: hypothetical protein ABJ327_06855 [Litoreibacter sp.]
MSHNYSGENTRPMAALMFRLPFMIDCATFEKFMIEYFEGSLSKRERFTFNLHILFCAECRRYLRDYQNTMALTKSQIDVSFSEMGMGDVPEELIDAILSARNSASKE